MIDRTKQPKKPKHINPLTLKPGQVVYDRVDEFWDYEKKRPIPFEEIDTQCVVVKNSRSSVLFYIYTSHPGFGEPEDFKCTCPKCDREIEVSGNRSLGLPVGDSPTDFYTTQRDAILAGLINDKEWHEGETKDACDALDRFLQWDFSKGDQP